MITFLRHSPIILYLFQDYRPFWPDRPGTSLMWDCGYSQYTVSLLAQDEFMPRTIRLRLESGAMTRDLVVVQASNWPQQCSPLSTVFDLIKLVDEEQVSDFNKYPPQF